MSDFLLANEPTIRLSAFLGILALMAAWEVAAPRRRREIPRVLRWTNNLGVVVADTILVRLTAKQKIHKEKRPDEDKATGVVVWDVEVTNQNDDPSGVRPYWAFADNGG